jgi:hypothetical protein
MITYIFIRYLSELQLGTMFPACAVSHDSFCLADRKMLLYVPNKVADTHIRKVTAIINVEGKVVPVLN